MPYTLNEIGFGIKQSQTDRHIDKNRKYLTLSNKKRNNSRDGKTARKVKRRIKIYNS